MAASTQARVRHFTNVRPTFARKCRVKFRRLINVYITNPNSSIRASSVTRKSTPIAATGENGAVSQLAILVSLVCAKYLYVACFSSYLVFYSMDRFAMSEASGLVVLFAFHAAVAGGGLIGGSFSDRIGTRPVIGFSFWAALPFALAFPWLGPVAGIAAALLAATVIASAFPAIVVHAQSLMPARIGMISVIFYGTAFGVAGLGAAALGWLADVTSLTTIFIWTSFMPLAGILTLFLRSNRGR